MSVRTFAIAVALVLQALFALGCGAKPIGTTREPSPPSGRAATEPHPLDSLLAPSKEQRDLWAADDARKRQVEQDQARMESELAKDPSRVHDAAVKAVLDYLPRAIGDKKAKQTEVELDPKLTETYGGAKWEVRGKLWTVSGGSAGDSGRQLREQLGTWTVEVRLDGARLRPSLVVLE